MKGFEMVVGLEVHVELKTKTKIFCGCKTDFGAAPNTQCCPICTGMPGTLPVLNRQAVVYAVMAGLATHCTIASYSKFDRKNYFYPDLPKAYQITQYDLPLCRGGYLDIQMQQEQKRIGITRIHLEEDAGKLIHDPEHGTLIDCNRCGVPLIEIVSEPDLRSAQEAVAYLQKLRAVLLYTGVSDCKMNEGSFRCDVNLSVREKGEQGLTTRTEMKNLNSFQFVAKAIDYEFRRQVSLLEQGEQIVQETRRYDEKSGKTLAMRTKEDAQDYRYFPEPDLPLIHLREGEIAKLAAAIPPLPDQRAQEYQQRYGIGAYESEQLVNSKSVADFFEAAAAQTSHGKLVANLLLGEAFRLMRSQEETIPISPEHFAGIAQLLAEETINASTAKRLVKVLWEEDVDPVEIVKNRGWMQLRDPKALGDLAAQAMAQNPKAVQDYRAGKRAALKALMGEMMKLSDGRADARMAQEILLEQLG